MKKRSRHPFSGVQAKLSGDIIVDIEKTLGGNMEKTPVAIAHAAKDEQGEWRESHDLETHLIGVAALAADFAKTFGPEWAELAGRWHDLGKYQPRFQHYIRRASGFEADFHADAHITGEDSPGKPGKAPHSTAGALLAQERFGTAGRGLKQLEAAPIPCHLLHRPDSPLGAN